MAVVDKVEKYRRLGATDQEISELLQQKLKASSQEVNELLNLKGITLSSTTTPSGMQLTGTTPSYAQVQTPSPEFPQIDQKPISERLSEVPGKAVEELKELGVGLIAGTGMAIRESARGAKAIGGLIKDIGEAPVLSTGPKGFKGTALSERLETTEDIAPYLPEAYAESAKEIGQAGTELVKGIIDSMVKTAENPLESFLDRPISTINDLAFGVGASGSLMRGITRGAVKSGFAKEAEGLAKAILSTERSAITTSTDKVLKRLYSENPIIKAAQVSVDEMAKMPNFKSAMELASKVPLGGKLVPDAWAAEDVLLGKISRIAAREERLQHLINRSKTIEEVSKMFKELDPKDVDSFVAITEGRASPFMTANGLSIDRPMQEALDAWRNLALKDATELGVNTATAQKVAWQPLVIASGKLGTVEQARKVYSKALSGDKKAIAQIGKASSEIESSFKQSFEQSQKARFPFIKQADLDEAWNWIKPDPMYYPHIFDQKQTLGSLFREAFQTVKPKSLKGRTGAEGFSMDVPKAIAYHRLDTQGFLNNQSLIERIRSFSKPLGKGEMPEEGWVAFAPQGYMRFYQGQLDVQKQVLRALESRGVKSLDDLEEVASQVFTDLLASDPKKFIGITKNVEMLQIPKTVAQAFKAQFTPALSPWLNQFVRVVYDNPLHAWRVATLGLSPRWLVNNYMGNSFFATVAGVTPENWRRASQESWKKLVPERVTMGGISLEGLPTSVKGRGVLETTKKVLRTPFELNSSVDDYARRAVYVNEATREASKQIMKETGKKFFDAKLLWEKFRGQGAFSESNMLKKVESFSPETTQQLINTTNDFMLDYARLTPIERNVIRRIVPFWSWVREINRYAARLPVVYPGRYELIKSLSDLSREANAKEWESEGIEVSKLKDYQQGSVPLGEGENGIETILARSATPLADVGKARELGTHPLINFVLEQMTGRETFTQRPFTSPKVVERQGKFYDTTDPDNPKELNKPIAPPLVAHLLRQLPQVELLETLVKKQPQFDVTGIFESNAKPVKRENVNAVKFRAARFLGIPISEIDVYYYLMSLKNEPSVKKYIHKEMFKREAENE